MHRLFLTFLMFICRLRNEAENILVQLYFKKDEKYHLFSTVIVAGFGHCPFGIF
jgi:hypothetical protein